MKNILTILHDYWGYESFRGVQSEIIESICAGRDTLGLMPTGGGKSLTFQVPALAFDGVCVVVTPLLALMKDQVWALRKRGILAAAVHSGMSQREITQTLDNCILGETKLLYVSPERLESALFIAKFERIPVSFITVDEAHCISQWGYDFRPSYLHISDLRKIKPDVPVLALTATATPTVIDDIQLRLGFRQHNVIRMSFMRKNLSYVVRNTEDKRSQLLHILGSREGSAIVYANSRAATKEVAEFLAGNGISAEYFHAGLETSQKDERQRRWQSGAFRVMVATNAFGMGIDKPDVRFVIHFDSPDSIEAYFQEAGRAGRDGDRSYAVLLYNDSETKKLKKRVGEKFPDKDYVANVYENIAYYSQTALGSGMGRSFVFDPDKFCRTYKFYPTQVTSAVRLLAQSGYIRYDEEPDSSPRVRFLLERDELYRLHGNTPMEDNVIKALLRTYTGLFTDYSFIDEDYLASRCGVEEVQVHQTLKALSHRRIIHFIPRRATPLITYLRPRVPSADVVIPKTVYEERKECYNYQIANVIKYATETDTCRSVALLRYFGEKSKHDCGCCDVCVGRKHRHDYMEE